MNQTCFVLPHFGFGKDITISSEGTVDSTECGDLYPNNFWMCVLGLFGTVILFRFMTIAILLIQECRCKKHKGDTRNMHKELA